METYFLSYFPPTLDRSSVLFHYPNSTERASGELSLRKCPPSLPVVPLLVFLLLLLLPRRRLRRVSPAATNSSLSAPLSLSQLSLSPVAHSPARTEEQKEEEEERVRPIRPHTVSSSDAPRRNIQSLVGDRTQQPERKRGGGGTEKPSPGARGRGRLLLCLLSPSLLRESAGVFSVLRRRGCEERRTEEGGGPPSSILLWRERSAISSQTSSSPFLSSLFHPLVVVGCLLLLQWGSALLMALLFFWGRSKGTALGLGTDGARLLRPLSTSELREQLLRWSKHAGSRRPKYIPPHTKKQHRRETFVECTIFAKAAKVDDFPRRTSCFDFLIRQESEQRK